MTTSSLSNPTETTVRPLVVEYLDGSGIPQTDRFATRQEADDRQAYLTARNRPSTQGRLMATAKCPLWCTDHRNDLDLDYHSTAMTQLAGCDINMTSGTHTGDAEIYGLYDVGDGESLTLDDAEQLARLLLRYVAAGRAGVASPLAESHTEGGSRGGSEAPKSNDSMHLEGSAALRNGESVNQMAVHLTIEELAARERTTEDTVHYWVKGREGSPRRPAR